MQTLACFSMQHHGMQVLEQGTILATGKGCMHNSAPQTVATALNCQPEKLIQGAKKTPWNCTALPSDLEGPQP